jgi:hypothetical protein
MKYAKSRNGGSRKGRAFAPAAAESSSKTSFGEAGVSLSWEEALQHRPNASSMHDQ